MCAPFLEANDPVRSCWRLACLGTAWLFFCSERPPGSAKSIGRKDQYWDQKSWDCEWSPEGLGTQGALPAAQCCWKAEGGWWWFHGFSLNWGNCKITSWFHGCWKEEWPLRWHPKLTKHRQEPKESRGSGVGWGGVQEPWLQLPKVQDSSHRERCFPPAGDPPPRAAEVHTPPGMNSWALHEVTAPGNLSGTGKETFFSSHLIPLCAGRMLMHPLLLASTKPSATLGSLLQEGRDEEN